MHTIQRLTGTITNIVELSPTARDYTITPENPLQFTAGSFVNVFIDHEGKTIRRAFSISSSDQDHSSFSLSIRLSPQGELTPILWSENYLERSIKIMGPLGRNTADTIQAHTVYLFGFGIGSGVVKSIADHLVRRPHLDSLTIMTGNRSVEEILHKNYFDKLSEKNSKVTVTYVVSDKAQSSYPTGYMQEHIDNFDFTNADVYMCGQGIACQALETTIKRTNPQNCNFFIEDFH